MISLRTNFAELSGRVSKLALLIAAGVMLSGCDDRRGAGGSYRAQQAIPAEALALMKEKGTDAHQPILIRAFKKEAELEVWKMRADGQYVHFKTYPMCRWSGQLGPKRREGDRQVPEGFYTITQGQLNPNSSYYLSFNVGYPNAYDKAHNYTGGSIMVHGDCSSAGCFSMTDEQIAEIYAVAREAFGGGQRAIQMQSLPFRMSAENLAKHRFDPNIRFWKQLKEGVDQFDVTKRETKVAICNQRYVFGATAADPAARFDANAECPVLNQDADLKTAVAAKQKQDEIQVAELVAKGTKAVKIVYADGGQHPTFTDSVMMLSRPEALAKAPVEVAINEKGQSIPTVVHATPASTIQTASIPQSSAAKSRQVSTVEKTQVEKTQVATTPVVAPVVATAFAGTPPVASERPFYKRWLGSEEAPAKEAVAVEAAAPGVSPVSTIPSPPRKDSAAAATKPQAALSQKKIPPEMKAYSAGDK